MYMDKKLIALLNDNFDRYKVYMDKSFKVKKNRLIEVETMIRSVVGNEPDYVKIPYEEHSRIELHLLLDERRSLLNWMFKETPEEWERMKVVNSRLLELTKELRLKMADVCDGLAKRKRDAFDDDYEVCGTLHFNYNDEDSVLPYKGAEIYGSDYRLMIATNNFLTGKDPFHYLELSCNYDDSRDIEFLKAETVTMIIHGLTILLLLKIQKSIFVIQWLSFVVTLAIRLRMYSN